MARCLNRTDIVYSGSGPEDVHYKSDETTKGNSIMTIDMSIQMRERRNLQSMKTWVFVDGVRRELSSSSVRASIAIGQDL